MSDAQKQFVRMVQSYGGKDSIGGIQVTGTPLVRYSHTGRIEWYWYGILILEG